MPKIYARQIDPEYQDSMLLFYNRQIGENQWEDEYWENVTLTGNRNYRGIETDIFKRVYSVLQSGDLLDELEGIEEKNGYANYDTATEAINDMLYPEKGKYSTMDIHNLKMLIAEYQRANSRDENTIICKVLSIVTGKEYDWTALHGSCQGDYIECFFPVDEYDKTSLKSLERRYFNEGSEWIVDDAGEFDPDSDDPGDISGYSIYCTEWDDEAIRREIAESAGVNPDDVIMYKHDGYIRTAKYQLVS